MAAPPTPESSGIASLKAAGRAFSFGRKKADSQIPTSRPIMDHTQSDAHPKYTRERAFTESSYTSESTATPPKLPGTGLDFGSTDNFGSMFESFGKRSSKGDMHFTSAGTGRPDEYGFLNPPEKIHSNRTSNTVLMPHFDQAMEPSSSPRSWDSRGSHDGLMTGLTPPMERTFSYEVADERIDFPTRPTKSRTMPLASSTSPPGRRKQRPPSDGLRRSSVYSVTKEPGRTSTIFKDDDAQTVIDSLAAGRKLSQIANTGGQQYLDEDDSFVRTQQSRNATSPNVTAGAQQYARLPYDSPSQPTSTNTTPRAMKSQLQVHEERSMFDASPPLLDQTSRKHQPRNAPPPRPQTSNKIMTPQQFERYRREQEVSRAATNHDTNDDSDDGADEYEDDDEIEHNKQLARQRKKQEAHLAVYRQQMLKVTGEQPAELKGPGLRDSSERPGRDTPDLPNRTSTFEINFEKPSDDGKGSDDEDEDVPLGVLAAHGFPSKSRPPTALSGGDSRIQYKSESYPPPPASTSGASQGGRASGLPPFAKRLPTDPYYGASLVNPSNRESMAFNQAQPGTHSSSAAPMLPPNVPPAGLVGVIAGEERARAARRGSPSAQGNLGPSLPPGFGQTAGAPPGMPPPMSPGERATMQMSEQMHQMMQMQMQWMQQMQQMMASGMQFPPGQQPPMMPGQPGMMMPPMMPPMAGLPTRPTSSGAHTVPISPGMQHQASRTMSMMGSSSTPPWAPTPGSNRQSRAPSVMTGPFGGPPQNYAASIAPSERSNVGMPSRYRPVSVAPAEEHASRPYSRSSTMNSNTLLPTSFGRESRLSTSQTRRSNLSAQASRKPVNDDDDDDEEGWEEMKKKRDKKKSIWKLGKKKEPLDSQLEYYDYPEN